MKTSNRRTIAMIMCALLCMTALVLPVFAGGSSEPEPEAMEAAPEMAAPRILNVGYTDEIDTLNALTSQNLTDIEISMVEGLIMSNDQNTYIPVLAKAIPTLENGGVVINADGTVEMTWNLLEGVQWHDGEEFTSADVKFTWEFITSEAGAAVYNQSEYLNIIACDTPDDYTVVFTWKGIYAPYASLFDTILPEHVLAGKDVLTADEYNRSPLGTGPFKFVEWKAGEYVRVERNDNYWRGPEYPKLDGIVFNFVPDANTRVNGLKAGEYDLSQVNPDQVDEVNNLPGYDAVSFPTNIWVYWNTNIASETGQVLFGDVNVRRAINYAIDKEAIVNDLLGGIVSLTDSQIGPASPYNNPDVENYPYNVELAREMLDDAGWTVGSDGIREKDGVRFSFTIFGRTSRPLRVRVAEVIQQYMKDIEIEVMLSNTDSGAYIEKLLSTDWEAHVGGWIIPADPSISSLYGSTASNNFSGHGTAELDEAMEASDGTLDFAERQALMFEVQAILADQAIEYPIFNQNNTYVMRDTFENFKGSGTNLGSYWNCYEWDF